MNEERKVQCYLKMLNHFWVILNELKKIEKNFPVESTLIKSEVEALGEMIEELA